MKMIKLSQDELQKIEGGCCARRTSCRTTCTYPTQTYHRRCR